MQDKYILPESSLISFFSNKVKLYGGINLAQGLPGFQPPKELLQKLSEVSLLDNVHQYAPGIGHFKLLELIQQNYQKQTPLTIENILITQGATEAITLVYLYLKQKYGRLKVLGFDPVYESYNNLPKSFNDEFIAYTLKDNQIDFDELEKIIKINKVQLIFINSPGNPLGRIFKEEEIKYLLQLSEKHEFYVLLDAVYKELYFNKPPYIPIDNENLNTFYVNSFSKLFSITGWRVGYLICHREHMKKIRSMHDYTGLCVSNPIQTAIAEYIYENGFVNDYVKQTRNNIFQSFNLLYNELLNISFKLPSIDGGYFIWAELPLPFDDGFKFAVDLYETQKIAIVPGIHFSQNAKRIVRFNAAHPIPIITKAVEGIKNFISEHSNK